MRPQAAVAAGVLPTLPGMASALGLSAAPAPPLLAAMYDASWLFGTAIAGLVYTLLMAAERQQLLWPERGTGGTGSVPPWPA